MPRSARLACDNTITVPTGTPLMFSIEESFGVRVGDASGQRVESPSARWHLRVNDRL